MADGALPSKVGPAPGPSFHTSANSADLTPSDQDGVPIPESGRQSRAKSLE
jgi:hypothetical protein